MKKCVQWKKKRKMSTYHLTKCSSVVVGRVRKVPERRIAKRWFEGFSCRVESLELVLMCELVSFLRFTETMTIDFSKDNAVTRESMIGFYTQKLSLVGLTDQSRNGRRVLCSFVTPSLSLPKNNSWCSQRWIDRRQRRHTLSPANDVQQTQQPQPLNCLAIAMINDGQGLNTESSKRRLVVIVPPSSPPPLIGADYAQMHLN